MEDATDNTNVTSVDYAVDRRIKIKQASPEKYTKNYLGSKVSLEEKRQVNNNNVQNSSWTLSEIERIVSREILPTPKKKVDFWAANLNRQNDFRLRNLTARLTSQLARTFKKEMLTGTLNQIRGFDLQAQSMRMASANAALGTYQFQRTQVLPYMRKSLSLSYQGVNLLKEVVSSITSMEHSVVAKLEAIKLNTGASVPTRKSFLTRLKEAVSTKNVEHIATNISGMIINQYDRQYRKYVTPRLTKINDQIQSALEDGGANGLLSRLGNKLNETKERLKEIAISPSDPSNSKSSLKQNASKIGAGALEGITKITDRLRLPKSISGIAGDTIGQWSQDLNDLKPFGQIVTPVKIVDAPVDHPNAPKRIKENFSQKLLELTKEWQEDSRKSSHHLLGHVQAIREVVAPSKRVKQKVEQAQEEKVSLRSTKSKKTEPVATKQSFDNLSYHPLDRMPKPKEAKQVLEKGTKRRRSKDYESPSTEENSNFIEKAKEKTKSLVSKAEKLKDHETVKTVRSKLTPTVDATRDSKMIASLLAGIESLKKTEPRPIRKNSYEDFQNQEKQQQEEKRQQNYAGVWRLNDGHDLPEQRRPDKRDDKEKPASTWDITQGGVGGLISGAAGATAGFAAQQGWKLAKWGAKQPLRFGRGLVLGSKTAGVAGTVGRGARNLVGWGVKQPFRVAGGLLGLNTAGVGGAVGRGVGSLAGKGIGGILSVGGKLGLAAAKSSFGLGLGLMAAQYLFNKTGVTGTVKRVGNTGFDAASGALLGATLGSFIPGLGTAVGAGIGGATGAVLSNKDLIYKGIGGLGKFVNRQNDLASSPNPFTGDNIRSPYGNRATPPKNSSNFTTGLSTLINWATRLTSGTSAISGISTAIFGWAKRNNGLVSPTAATYPYITQVMDAYGISNLSLFDYIHSVELAQTKILSGKDKPFTDADLGYMSGRLGLDPRNTDATNYFKLWYKRRFTPVHAIIGKILSRYNLSFDSVLSADKEQLVNISEDIKKEVSSTDIKSLGLELNTATYQKYSKLGSADAAKINNPSLDTPKPFDPRDPNNKVKGSDYRPGQSASGGVASYMGDGSVDPEKPQALRVKAKLSKGDIKDQPEYKSAYSKLKPEIKKAVDKSRALQYTLWTSAIQHGPDSAASIFNNDYNTELDEKANLRSIYQDRARRFDTLGESDRIAGQQQIYQEQMTAMDIQSGRNKGDVTSLSKGLNDIVSTNQMASYTGKNVNLKGSVADRANQAIAYLMNKYRYSKIAATAIVANLVAESSMNPKAVGDNGQALGLPQWHAPRRRDISIKFGKEVSAMNIQEQLDAVNWEIQSGKGVTGGTKLAKSLSSATDLNTAVYDVVRLYERPKDTAGDTRKRINIANTLIGGLDKAPSAKQQPQAPAQKQAQSQAPTSSRPSKTSPQSTKSAPTPKSQGPQTKPEDHSALINAMLTHSKSLDQHAAAMKPPSVVKKQETPSMVIAPTIMNKDQNRQNFVTLSMKKTRVAIGEY